MISGAHENFRWLETECELADVLARCPEIFLGRYIVVSSFDSGSYTPSDTESANGWFVRDGLAYSPRIESAVDLPVCGGYDEWYLFETTPPQLGTLNREHNIFIAEIAPGAVFTFVNFQGFSLSDPQYRELADLFWRQIAWIEPKPVACLADGRDTLIFATRDHTLFDRVSSFALPR